MTAIFYFLIEPDIYRMAGGIKSGRLCLTTPIKFSFMGYTFFFKKIIILIILLFVNALWQIYSSFEESIWCIRPSIKLEPMFIGFIGPWLECELIYTWHIFPNFKTWKVCKEWIQTQQEERGLAVWEAEKLSASN